MAGAERVVPEGEQESGELTRAVRATAVGRGTHGVPELRLLVEGALHRAFPYRIWVAGRVADVVAEPGVGLHFQLRASAVDDEPFTLSCLLPGDVLPQVADVLDRLHDADVADVVAEHRLARVGGLLRYDVGRATLVLAVSELDPAPTLRGLAEQREQARALVHAHGLAGRQRERPYRTAPLSVTLIGAEDDPAVARVRGLLQDSPYAVELRHARVPLQGAHAPAAVGSAVRESALRSDLVLLVRERGRLLTLGVFDAPEVTAAVADALVPVVCALGGNGEPTATDEVACLSLPDGDAAAAWVLDRLGAAEQSLRGVSAEIEEQAVAAGERACAELEQVRDEVLRTAAEAHSRAAVVRRRQRQLFLAGAGVLAVLVVLGAVLTGTPLVLLGLVGLAAVLLGLQQRSARAVSRTTTRGRPMSQQDDDFTALLAQLRQLRDDLQTTSSPETVLRLRTRADELADRAEAVLLRTVPQARALRPAPDAPTSATVVLPPDPAEAPTQVTAAAGG